MTSFLVPLDLRSRRASHASVHGGVELPRPA
ncbi:hypothetical protein J2X67_003553 [Variovorax sp. 3319]|nr:hypothetical protein [Variovorax sp. 3319]